MVMLGRSIAVSVSQAEWTIMLNRYRTLLILACFAWTQSAATVLACPMCKMAVEEDDPQPRAYFISILFMLGMISSVTSAVGGLLWYVNRAEQRNLTEAGYEHVLRNGVNAAAAKSNA